MLQAVEHRLSPFQWEVILGTLMGDGALSPSKLLKSDQARLVFHKDSVWLFELR